MKATHGLILTLLCTVGCTLGLTTASASALPSRFGSEGDGPGQISGEPRGIAVDQETGDVYVADRNNERIEKFGPDGQFLLAWGAGVADGEATASQVCTETCFKGFASSASGGFKLPEGIAVDNGTGPLHGDVYVVDSGNNRIQKFTPEGRFVAMLGGEVNANTNGDVCRAAEAAACQKGVEGTAPGEFSVLTNHAVTVGSNGVLYVGDTERVQRFSEEGIQEGEVLFPTVGRIENLAVDSINDLYLQASELAGVHEYDPVGKELGLPRAEAGYRLSLALAIGPADQLLVNSSEGCCGAQSSHILAFDATGHETAAFDRTTAQGEDGARGIAYSEFTHALYVVNLGAVRIVTLPEKGPFVLLGSQAVSEVQPTAAKLSALVNPEGPSQASYHFEYGTSASYGRSTPSEALSTGEFEDAPASAAIAKLQPETTYHFRAVAENAAGEKSFGADQTFATPPPISIDATSASHLTSNSVTLETLINPHGVDTRYRFEYGPTTSYGTDVPVPDGDLGSAASDVAESSQIEGLSADATYHYRVVAVNALGTIVGPDRAFTTLSTTSPSLLDGRAWEMVSPPDKHGASLEAISPSNGGLIQAASGGSAITYLATGPITSDPPANRGLLFTQVMSRRGPEGWSSTEITTPNETTTAWSPEVLGGQYKLFTPDLSAGLVVPEGGTPLSPEATERTPYRREADGTYTPLVYPGDVPPGTKFGGEGQDFQGRVTFEGASPDLNHVVVVSKFALTPDSIEPTGEGLNLYEWNGGTLRQVGILPNEKSAAEDNSVAALGQQGYDTRRAVSSDGARVIFDAAVKSSSESHLYVRDVPLGATVQLDAVQHGASGGADSGQPIYETASSDGSKVFFEDNVRLTKDASSGTFSGGNPVQDLYMCEVGEVNGKPTCTLKDLTGGLSPGQHAEVQGVIEASEDGRYVYYVANGVLAPGAAQGSCSGPPSAATCNLYVSDTVTGETRLVATLSREDISDWFASGGVTPITLTAKISPNGRYLAFMSLRSLTGYDNRDAQSGQPATEVFLYDAVTQRLVCASCNPSGARPDAVLDEQLDFPGLLVNRQGSTEWGGHWLAGSLPGWDNESQDKRSSWYGAQYVSDVGRLFFDSADALVPGDTNGREDVYEYEPSGIGDCAGASACVGLISSGTSREESALLDASESGDDVFFLTTSQLTPQDSDGSYDVYDAHACTSSSPCIPSAAVSTPVACDTADSCKAAISPQPGVFGAAASATFSGPGNAPPAPRPTTKPRTRAQNLAKALKVCRTKHKGRKRTACERQARKRYGAKRTTTLKTSHNRRSSK